MTKVEKVGDVLKASADFLSRKGVHEPRQACELLMSRLLSCGRLELFVRFENRLSANQLDAMRRGVKRLSGGEPAQYIVGQVEFMGHVFKVDRRALIPRPETELLVEKVLARESVWTGGSPLVADIGTGSGCIALSLALARPSGRYVAVDTSPGALELTAENARLLGVAGNLAFSSDVSSDIEPDSLDAVVANLPYIPTAEWEKLPRHIRDYEPREALDGGPDGLSVIREVLPDLWIVAKPGASIFLEIGSDQGEKALALLEENGFSGADLGRDLAGHDRIVCGVKAE